MSPRGARTEHAAATSRAPRGRRRRRSALLLALALLASSPAAGGETPVPRPPLAPEGTAWLAAGAGGVRGLTIGPIENRRHAENGYGTAASARLLDEAVAQGATWISITPFARVFDLSGSGLDLVFEAELDENRRSVRRMIDQAHARGLAVLVVPHLWVESGEWRALIDPGTDEGWARWAAAYREFVLLWADVAREAGAEMFSVGVELRSWVTTHRAPSFLALVEEVRARYPGLVTYSANWDDVEETVILGAVDLIGINAFYPLAEREGAGPEELFAGARRVAERLERLARDWRRPILFTEFGYTTRPDPALRPWEWPDGMRHVRVDQRAQAEAYAALLAPMLLAPHFAGFFVWRVYADPDDVSQEAEWGFSPRGKLAELALRDAFRARWAVDGPWRPGEALGRHRARTPGLYRWELRSP